MTIEINETDIVLRPSAIDGFFGCAYQWGKTFLEGQRSIPNSRAAIGTAIHKGAEVLWTDAMRTGKKDDSLDVLFDAAIEEWKEETHDGIQFGDGEDNDTCIKEIQSGIETFVEDIVPFAAIPKAVEKRYTVEIDNPLIASISGTVDYITNDTISDLKTSKRKPSPASYTTQQSVYKFLAEANGENIKYNAIHGVVLKAKPEGMILPLEPEVDQAKASINIILDTMDLIVRDVAPIETILRPNNKHIFCSKKFCAFYGKCPGTAEIGKTKVAVQGARL